MKPKKQSIRFHDQCKRRVSNMQDLQSQHTWMLRRVTLARHGYAQKAYSPEYLFTVVELSETQPWKRTGWIFKQFRRSNRDVTAAIRADEASESVDSEREEER